MIFFFALQHGGNDVTWKYCICTMHFQSPRLLLQLRVCQYCRRNPSLDIQNISANKVLSVQLRALNKMCENCKITRQEQNTRGPNCTRWRKIAQIWENHELCSREQSFYPASKRAWIKHCYFSCTQRSNSFAKDCRSCTVSPWLAAFLRTTLTAGETGNTYLSFGSWAGRSLEFVGQQVSYKFVRSQAHALISQHSCILIRITRETTIVSLVARAYPTLPALWKEISNWNNYK